MKHHHIQPNHAQPIHKEGFAFSFNASQCKACGGKCCVGESGYIFLTLSEAKAIAELLHMEYAFFLLHYVKKVGYRFSLIEKPYDNGFACVFFDTDTKQCQIYDKRPSQCQSFPFWEGFRKDEALCELCEMCMGVMPLAHKGIISTHKKKPSSTYSPKSDAHMPHSKVKP